MIAANCPNSKNVELTERVSLLEIEAYDMERKSPSPEFSKCHFGVCYNYKGTKLQFPWEKSCLSRLERFDNIHMACQQGQKRTRRVLISCLKGITLIIGEHMI